MTVLGRLSGAAAVALLGWFAFGVVRVFSPETRTEGPLVEECRRAFTVPGFTPSAADSVDLAWRSDHWMDSTLRCRMKASPGRVRAFRDAVLASAGTRDGRTTEVQHTPPGCKGDEYSCSRYGEIGDKKLPSWWDTRGVPDAEWFSATQTSPSGSNTRGVDFAASESGGWVFARRWRT